MGRPVAGERPQVEGDLPGVAGGVERRFVRGMDGDRQEVVGRAAAAAAARRAGLLRERAGPCEAR